MKYADAFGMTYTVYYDLHINLRFININTRPPNWTMDSACKRYVHKDCVKVQISNFSTTVKTSEIGYG